MSFEVELWFRAEWRGGRGTFSVFIRLPFAPYPGLNVWLPSFGEDCEGVDVKRVIWLAGDERFCCETCPDCAPDTTAEELRAYYGEQGWVLEEDR